MSARPWPDAPATTPAVTRPGPLATTDRPGRVVAVRGAHGGAGATTVAAHLAGAWARWGPGPAGLLDLAGGLAYRLDLAPACGPGPTSPPSPGSWTAGRSPRRSPSRGRACGCCPWPGWSTVGPSRHRTRTWSGRSWRLVGGPGRWWSPTCPPAAGPPVDTALGVADVLLAVGGCHTAGVRGARAALDLWEAAGRNLQAAGAVITGVRSRAPLAPREARAALGERLWALVADDAAEFAAAAEDGMLLLDRPELPAVQALVALANRVMPFPKRDA